MNIVLVNPPSGKYAQPPLGLLSLGTILKHKGHSVKIIDMNLKDVSYNDLSYENEADVFGIGLVSPAYKYADALTYYISTIHKARIIVGGAHPSALPEKVMQELSIDSLVIGEGEIAIFDALECDGIIKADKPVNMDDLPMPDYTLLDMKKYHPHPPHGKHEPFVPLLTSRGCTFDCIFCSRSVFGRSYRSFSAERVVSEIEHAQKTLGVKEIAFYDDVFTLNRKRTLEICERLINKNIKIGWSCESRVDLVDRELLEVMKSAGCFGIAFGIESGNKDVLDYINKNVELYQVYKALHDTQQLGMETTGYFMFVPEKDNSETIQDTIDLAKRLNMDYVQFSKMTPLPGSKIYNGDNHYDGYALFGKNGNDEIDQAIQKAYKEYYVNERYIYKRLVKSLKSFSDFKMTVRGLRMMYSG